MGSPWTCTPDGIIRALDDVGAVIGPQKGGVAGGTRTGSAAGGAGAEAGATAVAAISGICVYASIYSAIGGWTGGYLSASTRRAPWFIPQTLEQPQGTPEKLGTQELEECGTCRGGGTG